ncbi:MAG: TonB-dependent receptor [Trichlorobacter sp.]|uniref:TonB-dependent receptor plug domain-containing protein n=1 Tax=Trichlorobacter sp. TaxID=2911007 RepID=UPI00255DC855|nr:TonB-dependent receptor [Trichlorobacter sp.]MDK9719397.1 TonB-dependent receptor [Trichlorobacter sp.]
MTKVQSVFQTIMITVLFPTALYAQQTAVPSPEIGSLEQLLNTEVTTVTAASKYQQDLTSAPASVSIITADDFRKYGYRTLAEAINSLRGFYSTYNRSYQSVGVRGFSPLGDYSTRILVLVDGHRLNDAVYEQAPLGSDFPVDVDMIDRVEVIRGPGSSLYGTNAFVAVINVITRGTNSLKGGEGATSGGSFNAWTGRASAGSKLDSGLSLLLSGSYRDSAGKRRLQFPEYSTNNGTAQSMDGETSWDLLFKAGWKDFSLLVLHQTRDKQVPTAPYTTIFNDPAQIISDRRTMAGLSFSRTFPLMDLNARITYNRYEYDGTYPLDNSGTYTLNYDETVAQWLGTDLYGSKNLGNHLITVGTEQRWQFDQQQLNYNIFPAYQSILNNNHASYAQGYYLQDEYHITKTLILNTGIRYDHYSTFGGTWNPRAAVIWNPIDSTVLRLSYGEAFRAPNAYELYYNDTTSTKGNVNLKPEKIRMVELSYDQYIGNNLRTGITGFYSRINDLLEQATDPGDGLLQFRNQSKVETKGIELQAEGKWENGYSGRISYSYQAVKNLDTGVLMNNSPRTLLKAALTAPLPAGKTFATLESCYTGSSINSNQQTVAGAAVVNLTVLNRDLIKGLELSGSVEPLAKVLKVGCQCQPVVKFSPESSIRLAL